MTDEQVEAFTQSMWLAVTKTSYALAHTKGQKKLKYRYVDEIARSLLENMPNSAHLYALERINTIGELQTDMWRQVLAELDKLEAQNERVGKHIDEQGGEPRNPYEIHSSNDSDKAQGQSTSSGVDEPAP